MGRKYIGVAVATACVTALILVTGAPASNSVHNSAAMRSQMMKTQLCRTTTLCKDAYLTTVNGRQVLILRHTLSGAHAAGGGNLVTPIRNVTVNGCMSTFGAAPNVGAYVRLGMPCSYNSNQTWNIIFNGNSWFIQSLGSATANCMNDKGGSAANGTPINLWDCNWSAWQTFWLNSIGSGGLGNRVIITPNSNRWSSCLSTGGKNYNGGIITVWPCGSTNGEWTVK